MVSGGTRVCKLLEPKMFSLILLPTERSAIFCKRFRIVQNDSFERMQPATSKAWIQFSLPVEGMQAFLSLSFVLDI